MSDTKFTFPVGYHEFHNVEEREIGNGPHLYPERASAASRPDKGGNSGLALEVMANWVAEKS